MIQKSQSVLATNSSEHPIPEEKKRDESTQHNYRPTYQQTEECE